MPVITVFSQKGGTGKTTLSINLHHGFLRSEVKTLLIDLDIQKSIVNIDRMLQTDWNITTTIDKKQIQENTITIIDTIPDIKRSKKAIEVADLVLIPLRPSPTDLLTTLQTIEAIKEMEEVSSMHVILNAVVSGTEYNQSVRENLEGNGISVLKTEIGNRLDFARCLLETGSIYDTRNTKAKNEIDKLCLEIYGKLVG